LVEAPCSAAKWVGVCRPVARFPWEQVVVLGAAVPTPLGYAQRPRVA
jgi:hypothetical protein